MPDTRLHSTSLHIVALWALAVAQPLFDLLGRSPEFFIAHRAGAADILLMTSALVLVPPAALAAVARGAAWFGDRIHAWTLGAMVAGLVAVVALQVAPRAGVDTWPPAAAISAAVGVAAGIAYVRRREARTFLVVLSAAGLVVPALFLLRPGIRSLVLPRPAEAASAGSNDLARTRAVPVVMVVFDELALVSLLDAKRQIDGALYPNLAALARDGVWYRNATTVNDYTRWALPAILTGRYPTLESVPTPADHPDTLFALLAPTHRLEVVEAVTDLCPAELCLRGRDPLTTRVRRMGRDLGIVFLHLLATPDLEKHLPDVSRRWAGFGDDTAGPAQKRSRSEWQERWRQADGWNRDEIAARPAVVQRFIDGIGAGDPQPTFYFLHSLLTHGPYTRLPGGQHVSSRPHVPGPTPTGWTDDEWAVAQSQQQQLLQVGYADRLVGELIERLQTEGLYDRSLVIVTSDHGVAFRAGSPLRQFTDRTAAEIMRVPLIVKYPKTPAIAGLDRLRGQVVDWNVETIDIAPTVLDVVGVPRRAGVDGLSLLDDRTPRRPARRFNAAGEIRTFAAEGPPIDEALARKTATFGDGGGNPYRIPRLHRIDALLGRPAADLPRGPARGEVEVDQSPRYADMDPASASVPFDVAGWLKNVPADAPPAYLAVAVNGVVQAVTRSWQKQPERWVATPPLDVWRRGHNDVQVFVVEEASGDLTLHPLTRRLERPPDLNLISGTAHLVWDVEQSGFYAHEGPRGREFRWTRGHGRVVVPLSGATPRTVRVRLARGILPRPHVKIVANECVLFDDALPRREWEGTFALGRCGPLGTTLAVSIISEAAPGPGRDRRRLGVAVRHVMVN